MTGAGVVLLTTFLAAVVEAIEMVTIVVGVGATRGYRYTLMGAAAGLVVKGIVRVAARGFAGYHGPEPHEGPPESGGFDSTAAFLAFKGVSLEGLEIAIIVISFGASAGQLGPSIIGGAAAIVVVGAAGFALQRPLERIPRSFLQLVVGTMLTSFGTFWALEGLGVNWPQSDADIVVLLIFYGLFAMIFIGLERRARQQTLEAVRT